MKVVILCGGLGTRLREETEFRPKPMVPVGGRPIIWHIMKSYAAHGHKDFILCLGYKGEVIKEYFRNYHWNTSDVTLRLGAVPKIQYHGSHAEEDWTVTLVDTGQETLTGGRLQRVLPHVGDEPFLLSYGDGLTDSDINKSIEFHKKHGALVTVTAVAPESRFGELKLDGDTVYSFREKQVSEAELINGGYFVINPGIGNYLTGDSCVFEQEPMRRLAEGGQLKAWVHRGFWQCMDTFREQQMLEENVAIGRRAVENLVMFSGAYRDKVVWLSGHTGFKGAWLAMWLLRLGARVHGFSLAAEEPSLFKQLGIESQLAHGIGDVRDIEAVKESIARIQPDFVFHLAAQALVRRSYEEPLLTYDTNIMGTAHVLEALRSLEKPCAAVFVTTDKCYENREIDHAYVEEDHLGGYDPYSSSKAAAEIIIGAYRRSFFGKSPVRIASARAGNVIGGGDWALDRIVPDIIRALRDGRPIPVRNAVATRPWQHVLEPLSGYLWLGTLLLGNNEAASAFNFGPEKEANRPVIDLVREALKHWPGKYEDKSDPSAPHEARLLMLSTEKAKRVLKWKPAWDFEAAIKQTVDWYRSVNEDVARAKNITLKQIDEYEQAAAARVVWATK